MKTEPNESAFPLPEYFRELGITKRKYFAAMAMHSLREEKDNLYYLQRT
jgi:hypothetical protein